MTRRFRGLAALFVALSLIAGACGSDREDDSAVDETATTASDTGAGDTAFGTLDSPCGEGDASGATDQGVTDDAIEIAYGDDAGFPQQPGLTHEASDAVEAMIEWCNEQGGINGRQINGTYYDAKITEVNNAMTEACAKAFYLVGEYWVLDDGQEPKRRECELPAVPMGAGTAKFANAPLMHMPTPNPLDRGTVSAGYHLKELFPEEVKAAGVMWGDYPVIHDRRDQTIEAFEQIGYTFRSGCSVSYNITGEPDWKPFAQKLKECGAKWVYWVGSPPYLQAVLEASDQLEYHPVWYVNSNAYDKVFAKWNLDGYADRVYFQMVQTPFEEAEHSDAVQQYLDLIEDHGGDAASAGMMSTSAFLLWATAAKACGSDLTRECVENELDQIHEWDGGGLHAPADPGANEPSKCGLLMQMKGTEYVRVTPEEPGEFDCDDSYVVKLTGDAVKRNRIGVDRIAPL